MCTDCILERHFKIYINNNKQKTMPYLMKVTSVVLFVSTLFVPSSSLDPFACFQDICNRDPTNPQYCNTKEGQWRCQNCKDVASLCEGSKMPYNCTSFCINKEVEEQMQTEKGKACTWDSIPQTKNGDLNGDHSILDTYHQGSVINYTCHDGYSPIGPAATCGPFGQWSPPSICQATFCTLPKMTGLFVVPVEDRYPVSKHVRLTCTANDKITVELQCTSTGMWDHPLPNCHTADSNDCTTHWIFHGIFVVMFILAILGSKFSEIRQKCRINTKSSIHDNGPESPAGDISNSTDQDSIECENEQLLTTAESQPDVSTSSPDQRPRCNSRLGGRRDQNPMPSDSSASNLSTSVAGGYSSTGDNTIKQVNTSSGKNNSTQQLTVVLSSKCKQLNINMTNTGVETSNKQDANGSPDRSVVNAFKHPIQETGQKKHPTKGCDRVEKVNV